MRKENLQVDRQGSFPRKPHIHIVRQSTLTESTPVASAHQRQPASTTCDGQPAGTDHPSSIQRSWILWTCINRLIVKSAKYTEASIWNERQILRLCLECRRQGHIREQ